MVSHVTFEELTEPYRGELRLHCYRILGSLSDAEDALQETLLAAWRGLDRFEERSSVRTWLYRIATNRCLNALRDAGRRMPVAPVPPFEPPEPSRRDDVTWLQPYPDALLDPEARYLARESVELAFVAGLQRLPPRQAAALVLRDVLGFSTAEVADLLDTSETAVKGALQRARAALSKRPPSTAPAPGSTEERALTRRFADAFAADDLAALVALLTDDAWLAMPPAPHVYDGPEAIAGFLAASADWRDGRRFRLVETRANSQPAFACALDGQPAGLVVLTLAAERIRGITRFLSWDPESSDVPANLQLHAEQRSWSFGPPNRTEGR